MQSEKYRLKLSTSGPELTGFAKKWKASIWIRAQLSCRVSDLLASSIPRLGNFHIPISPGDDCDKLIIC
jgi:hypothetical protein